ncbi:MAG TPA: hypothetical protein VGG74_21270 [Kofleriaceae bacterium]
MTNGVAQTKTIRGVDVTTVKMRAMRGSRLRHEVQRLIAKEADRRGTPLTKIGKDDVRSIITTAFASMTADEHERFTIDALRETSVVKRDGNGQPRKIDLLDARSIDDAFGTDHYALEAAVMFAVETNLAASFVEGAGSEQPTPTP